eukprot:CAMPEP_0113555400 /NCGR_PEP_ID=MMETSP0015_2-20120614/16691_1 /TAXON_ID=2838 /ORGANISM="Odontella" /LENGTH=60 /DNA_ID=CAMNT_0000456663 /DNA_START=44 /DNA_END=224 /DNA_ORIENTATION=+ /assembly_acc=CAM_ASM_000160
MTVYAGRELLSTLTLRLRAGTWVARSTSMKPQPGGLLAFDGAAAGNVGDPLVFDGAAQPG